MIAMAIPAVAALWFLPFVLPICFYVAFTDMREMRITNQAVIALACVYIVVGPFGETLLLDWGLAKVWDMAAADLPKVEVDPQTYEVRADGELLTCDPAEELPLAQRYFLF